MISVPAVDDGLCDGMLTATRVGVGANLAMMKSSGRRMHAMYVVGLFTGDGAAVMVTEVGESW